MNKAIKGLMINGSPASMLKKKKKVRLIICSTYKYIEVVNKNVKLVWVYRSDYHMNTILWAR